MSKLIENRLCNRCSLEFGIFADEKSCYDKLDLPFPTYCQNCREQSRLSFRNERSLYRGNCDLCKKRMLSVFSPDKPYRVYCPECWYSDKWDARSIGREYDFSRGFFEQYEELFAEGTYISLLCRNNQNSDYVNQETDDKNCYYNFGGHYNEDCYYNTYSLWGKDNVDNYWVIKCELCYECIDCEQCYNSTYLQDCLSCSDSHYSRDCISCSHCFACFGLRHKSYCFFNEQLDSESYQEKVAEYLISYSGRQSALEKSTQHFLKYPHKAVKHIRVEDSSGDRLLSCRKTREAFLSEKSEDCCYLYITLQTKDCTDLSSVGWSELAYQCSSSMELNNVVVAVGCVNLSFSSYCYQCMNSTKLFACTNMNQAQYCILNKQYSKERYHELVSRIIQQMKENGEWGSFFPNRVSPFCYNESIAQEYFPRKAEDVFSLGWGWRAEQPTQSSDASNLMFAGVLPERISDFSDELGSKTFPCELSGRPYRIQKSELGYYRKMKLPIPRLHPDMRHARRLALRNPRRLWQRVCAKDGVPIQTSYAPKRPEIVYCEKCFEAG